MIKGRHRSPVGMGQRIGPSDDSPKGGVYPVASSSSGFHRSFGRGGGRYRRGPSQLRLPPPPPPSKEDILMEAGRLAAEYLVAQGMLPASSLPPPPATTSMWQQNGGFQDPSKAGQGDRDRVPSPRTSALDRLGSGDLKELGGHGRRRYGEDYPPSSSRGRGKRMGSYASRWGGDSGRAPGGWTERSRGFDEIVMEEDEEDPAPGYRRRWPDNYGASSSSSGGGAGSLPPTDGEVVVPRNETVGVDADLDAKDYGAAGDGGSVKAAGLSCAKEEEGSRVTTTTTTTTTVTESNVKDDDVGNSGNNAVVVKSEPDQVVAADVKPLTDHGVTVEGTGIIPKSADIEKKDKENAELDSSMPEPVETTKLGEEELLRFCTHFGFPRKRRSSLGNRGTRKSRIEVGSCSKASAATEPENQEEEPAVAEEEMANESPKAERDEESEVAVAVEFVKDDGEMVVDADSCCSRDSFNGAIHNANSEVKQVSDSAAPSCSDEESRNPSPAIEDDKVISEAALPPSLPESSPVPPESSLVVQASSAPGMGLSVGTSLWPESSSAAPIHVDSCKSLPLPEASGGSAYDDDALAEASGSNKRGRDSYADVILQEDDCGKRRNLNGKHFCLQGGKQIVDEGLVDASSDHKKMGETELSWEAEAQPMATLEEGKQLIPNLFKICDLNLMGTPEVTEVSGHPVRERGSDTTTVLQTGDVPSVDFGLSIGKDNRNADIYAQSSDGSKAVQVIDLEDDSPVERGACDQPKPRNDAMYGLEGFLNNPESAVDLPDIQDGYDHAITDLLGSEITSCPSVTADINGLQPAMSLHGTEGMAGDDDSIYVSLAELPIEFMNIWDHPHQEYGKYF